MYCQVSGGDCELQNCRLPRGHDPLAAVSPTGSPSRWMPRTRTSSWTTTAASCAGAACAPAASWWATSPWAFEERGASSLLVADFGVPLGESTCISCGTCVQVCPTGALIDRDSAYRGRETQVEHTKTICVGCSLGCGMDVLTRDNHLVRIDGDWDAAVNDGVLCKVGRFEPQADERERILTPLVRKNGSLKAATWDEALETIASQLKPLAGKNGDGVAAMASTRLPAEALSAFKQIFAGGLDSALVTSTEEGSATAAGSAVAHELGQPFEGQLGGSEIRRLRRAGWRRPVRQPPGGRVLRQAHPANGHQTGHGRSAG